MVNQASGLDDVATPQEFDLVLLSNFVHQVVNPLNGVAGTLSNLLDGTISQTSRREQRLRAARAQVEQCISLMRNLAFLSRGFSPLTENDRRLTVLPQAIIESAMFYQEDGQRKKIIIFLHDKSEQNKVQGHPELIRQVFMNMFDNWIKYGRNETTVNVHQRIQKNTGHAIITMSGECAGSLSAADLPKIFDLGFRGSNARQIVASGTGLGLYISKQIVEKVHGGQLSVQRLPNNGLEFIIKLPNGEIG